MRDKRESIYLNEINSGNNAILICGIQLFLCQFRAGSGFLALSPSPSRNRNLSAASPENLMNLNRQ